MIGEICRLSFKESPTFMKRELPPGFDYFIIDEENQEVIFMWLTNHVPDERDRNDG